VRFEESAPIAVSGGGFRSAGVLFHARALPSWIAIGPKSAHPGRAPLAFTVAPHLQLINYRGCFCRFVGI
jgi:hypothetical protein